MAKPDKQFRLTAGMVKYPPNEKSVEIEGVDVDVVEVTIQQLDQKLIKVTCWPNTKNRSLANIVEVGDILWAEGEYRTFNSTRRDGTPYMGQLLNAETINVQRARGVSADSSESIESPVSGARVPAEAVIHTNPGETDEPF
jgi:hypothetical protein